MKGRSLDEGDVAGTVPVTVINETMAKTYFKGEDPIGKRILIRQLVFGKAGRGPDIAWQVVGVVNDEKVGGKGGGIGLDEDIPVVYVTFYQNPGIGNSLVVRSAVNPLVLSEAIEQAIWQVNNNQAVTNIETLEEIKSESVAPARLRTALLAIFAGIALLLAAIGIYGVVSYSVAQRMREMAIRVAVGASPGDLLKLVIGRTMLIVLVGLALVGSRHSRLRAYWRACSTIQALPIGDLGRHCGFARGGGAPGQLFSGPARDEGGSLTILRFE